MTIAFLSSALKHPNKTFLVSGLQFVFFLQEILQFLKFKRTDFKHGNSLFKEVLA